VAIDPAPFRGVLPPPISSPKSTLRCSETRRIGTVSVLTYDQFRYAFANA